MPHRRGQWVQQPALPDVVQFLGAPLRARALPWRWFSSANRMRSGCRLQRTPRRRFRKLGRASAEHYAALRRVLMWSPRQLSKRLARIIEGNDPLARDALKKELERTTEAVRSYAASLMEDGPRSDAAVARELPCPVAEVVTSRGELSAFLKRNKVANGTVSAATLSDRVEAGEASSAISEVTRSFFYLTTRGSLRVQNTAAPSASKSAKPTACGRIFGVADAHARGVLSECRRARGSLDPHESVTRWRKRLVGLSLVTRPLVASVTPSDARRERWRSNTVRFWTRVSARSQKRRLAAPCGWDSSSPVAEETTARMPSTRPPNEAFPATRPLMRRS